MSTLKNKIDFVVFISAKMANPNGDPLNGNRPRTDYSGYGEMSDVCIKRKLRNRMQDMRHPIFVQMNERCEDGCKSLSERAQSGLGANYSKEMQPDEIAKKACETWLDVRSFGQVFAFKTNNNKEGVSVGVRGPVSVHQAVSASPVEVETMKITKSVNGDASKGGDTKSSDTMGDKHFVRFGLYEIKGSINVQLAQKTGFTYDDAMVIKEALRTLFENDSSSARPEGSMEVLKLYWFEHNCPAGQYSTAKVHRSIEVKLKDGVTYPKCVDDYEFVQEELPGLTPEVIDGI